MDSLLLLFRLSSDAAIDLRKVLLLRKLVEDLLQCGLMGLILVDQELVGVGLHFLNEGEEEADALPLGLHDLDGHLVASEVDELSVAKLSFKLFNDGGDLTEHHDLLEKLLKVDRLTLLDELVLDREHTVLVELARELLRHEVLVLLVILLIVACLTLEPLNDSLLDLVDGHEAHLRSMLLVKHLGGSFIVHGH